jgi:hypothetical protein
MFSELKNRIKVHLGIRFRMTVLFTVILALALIAFSVMLYRSFLTSHQTEFDIALYNHAVDIAGGVDINAVGEILYNKKPLEETKIFPFALSQTYIVIRTIDGRVLAHSGPTANFFLPFEPEDYAMLARGKDSTFETITADKYMPAAEDRVFRLINFPLDDSVPPTIILQIAAPVTRFQAQIETLAHSFFLYIPIVIFIASAGGYYLSGRTLAPVRKMIHRANDLSPQHLTDRLPIPEVRDEIQELAQTMNRYLDRVEAAFQSQERFVADASHQLMTPLAILRGELDTLNRASPEEMKAFLGSASQEIDRLTKTVSDMLLLARVDAGVSFLNMSQVALDELLLEVLSRVNRAASSKQVRLIFNIRGESDEPTEIRGDRDLLLSLFFNLIENAVKYSPPGGSVEVSTERRDASGGSARARVEICDQGPGIPEAERPYIFERFYRGARTSHKTQGVGLGLAISKKIVDLHGFQMWVEAGHQAQADSGEGAATGAEAVSPAAGVGTRFVVEMELLQIPLAHA